MSFELIRLVQGFPGRSTRHGGLGWSSITALRGDGRLVMVDTGSFGMRPMLERRFAEYGIDPAEVTDVLLTHAHHDHAANYLLFANATVHIGAAEVAWACEQGATFMPLPELYARDMATNPRVRKLEPGPDGAAEVLPGITAYAAPGHTPGSMVYLVDRRVLFTGDAAKNRAELLSYDVDMTTDRETSRSSVASIVRRWRENPGTLLVPGHDVPLRWPEGADRPEYDGTRDAGLAAWFGDDLGDVEYYDFKPGQGTR
jgi:N-acyl homoserine lactone hydrolase